MWTSCCWLFLQKVCPWLFRLCAVVAAEVGESPRETMFHTEFLLNPLKQRESSAAALFANDASLWDILSALFLVLLLLLLMMMIEMSLKFKWADARCYNSLSTSLLCSSQFMSFDNCVCLDDAHEQKSSFLFPSFLLSLSLSLFFPLVF